MLSRNFNKNPFNQHVIIGFVVLLFVLFSSSLAYADTLTWTNSGGSGVWHDDTNWNPTQVPADGDDVIIPAGTDPVTYSSGTTNLNSLSCSASLTVSGGTLTLATASTVSASGALTLSGGILGGSGALTVSGSFNWSGGTLTGGGTFTTSGASTIAGFVTLDGRKLTNTGTVTWSSYWFYFANNAEIDNQSAISMDSSFGLSVGYSGAISGTFTNAGTLTISGGAGTVAFNIPLSNSGTVALLNGTVKLSSDLISTGIFRGTGTLDASSINFVNDGRLQPGTSPGTFNFTGNYQQSASGALDIEIAGTASTDYDQLAISGNSQISGILDVQLVSPFTPADGDSFTIVTFTASTGLFNPINYPVLPAGLAWQYKALATTIQLYCGTDTDLDGLPDSLENTTCTLVNDADSDADDLLDGQEDLNKNGQKDPWETDPCDDDTDNDTMPDGWSTMA